MTAALAPRQRRFVDEYLIDLNATQAAIRAGYSARTAEQIGWQLLQKPSVRAAVDAGQKDAALRARRELNAVLRDVAAIRQNAMQFVEREGVSSRAMRDPRAALQAIKLESELLGLFKQIEPPRNTLAELLAGLSGNVVGINPNPRIERDEFVRAGLPDVA